MIRLALGQREDGTWAAYEVADIQSRQNGKNFTMILRQLAGLFLWGEELAIHTAHIYKTSAESFKRIVGIIKGIPELRSLVYIRYGSGEQAIEHRNGCRLIYAARNADAGRGFAGASSLYLDEALRLNPAHLGALTPTLMTSPNAQIWYASSGGLSDSTVLWSLRKRALSGDGGRLAYMEHTAEDVRLGRDGDVVSVRPDPDDQDAWVRANPGLGRTIKLEKIADQRRLLDTNEFMREHLCVWDPEPTAAGQSVFGEGVWAACEDPDSSVEPEWFGVEILPERGSAAIAVAGRRPDGRVHVEIVDHREGVEWCHQRLVELHGRWKRPVLIREGGAAMTLVGGLQAAGVEVEKLGWADYQTSCGQFFDEAQGKGLVHIGQSSLNVAVGGAKRRDRGEAWVWAPRLSSSDTTPLTAATLALGRVLKPSAPPADPKFFDLGEVDLG